MVDGRWVMGIAMGFACAACVESGGEGGGDAWDLGGDGPVVAGSPAPPDEGEPPAGPYVGTAAFVLVDRQESFEGLDVSATFYSEPLRNHVEVAQSGRCRLLATDPGFYDEKCPGYCEANGGCVPFPASPSVGNLVIAGTRAELELTPWGPYGDVWRYLYSESGEQLSGPSEPVTVTAEGGALGAFEVTAPAPDPLFIEVPYPQDMLPGSPYTFTWPPGTTGARVHLRLESNITSHGPPRRVIECDAPDAEGSVTIPQEFIDEWSRFAYCGLEVVRRYHAAPFQAGDLDVEFTVQSSVRIHLSPCEV